MTSRRLVLVLAAVALAASVSVSTGRSTTITRAVLVGITGNGNVTSTPKGITCPRTCFTRFPRDILVRLMAHPAAGWRLAGWSGYCRGKRCAFHLTTPHDCSGQLCSVGVFGLRVRFVRR
jgi:hypothetical protein